jgi:hypothetical protein
MTLLEIKAQIVDHFVEFDVFGLSDFEHVELDEQTEDWRDELVSLALLHLEQDGLCALVDNIDQEKAIWILTAPIESVHGGDGTMGRN